MKTTFFVSLLRSSLLCLLLVGTFTESKAFYFVSVRIEGRVINSSSFLSPAPMPFHKVYLEIDTNFVTIFRDSVLTDANGFYVIQDSTYWSLIDTTRNNNLQFRIKTPTCVPGKFFVREAWMTLDTSLFTDIFTLPPYHWYNPFGNADFFICTTQPGPKLVSVNSTNQVTRLSFDRPIFVDTSYMHGLPSNTGPQANSYLIFNPGIPGKNYIDFWTETPDSGQYRFSIMFDNQYYWDTVLSLKLVTTRDTNTVPVWNFLGNTYANASFIFMPTVPFFRPTLLQRGKLTRTVVYRVDSLPNFVKYTKVDSITTDSLNSPVSYTFDNLKPARYLIRSWLATDDPDSAQFLPTYRGDFWDSLRVSYSSSSTIRAFLPEGLYSEFYLSPINKPHERNVFLVRQQIGNGPGTIFANVSAPPQKTNSSLPGWITQADVFLIGITNNVRIYTHPQSNGAFTFSNLPVGRYHLIAEKIGVFSERQEVEITATNPSPQIPDFVLPPSAVTSVDDGVDGGQHFTLYPNPTSGRFELTVSQAIASPGRVELVDVMGKVGLSQPVSQLVPGTQLTIDGGQLAKGIYQVRICTGVGTFGCGRVLLK